MEEALDPSPLEGVGMAWDVEFTRTGERLRKMCFGEKGGDIRVEAVAFEKVLLGV